MGVLTWTGSAEKKNGGVRWSKTGCGSVMREHPSVLWSDDVGPLRLERRHGFCTAAYPSWSRTSSPPGWFGRALEMKGDRQIAETRAAGMSHLSMAEVCLSNCLLIYLTAIFVFIQVFSDGIELGYLEEVGRREGEEREASWEGGSIKLTYSTDEARVVPAVAQGLQEAIPGINLKVTAVAFGAKHLLIVCGDKGDTTRVR